MSPERHQWKPAVQICRSNVENASVTYWSLISNARASRVN